jgi:hypothetical protein
MNSGPQRRRYPRYFTDLEVTVYVGTKAVPARITQVSRGGCLIFPPLPAQQSAEVKISFRLTGNSDPVNCKGEIVYSINDRGTGVAFTEISLYNQDRISDFFAKQPAAEQAPGP